MQNTNCVYLPNTCTRTWNFRILAPLSSFSKIKDVIVFTHSFILIKMNILPKNWMENSSFQNFGKRHILASFSSSQKIIRDRGNASTYYMKFSTQSIQRLLSTYYRKFSTQSIQRLPSTYYRKFSTQSIQRLPSTYYRKFST